MRIKTVHPQFPRLRFPGRVGRPIVPFAPGGIRRAMIDADQEVLTGQIGDMKASAPEERFARALDKLGIQYQFRLALGGPRNAPGFFELDFLFPRRSLYYAVEIDSAFSHRDKVYRDRLHDAMVLKELDYLGLYPQVLHFDMERDLTDQHAADQSVRQYFQ